MTTDQPEFTRKQIVFLVVGVAVMAAILALPTPETITTPTGPLALSARGKAALAVLAMAVILWATEAIPFAVTGLVACVLLVATKVASLQVVVQ